MVAKNTTILIPKEELMDDLTSKNDNEATDATNVDMDKLAKLKAKLEAKKEQEMPVSKVVEKTKSINFGIIGSGQGGGRLADTFYKLGYDAVALNTAPQDLEFIELPASNKLLLNYSIGGAAKSLEIGRDAANAFKEQITEIVNNQLADAQIFIFCTSLGGGSGAGSTEVLVDILASLNKPIIVLTILPMDSEDVQTKHNTLETLNKLATFVRNKKIANLICVDNAKIETIYRDVNQMDFYQVANKAIVEPLDVFNCQSSRPSSVKGIDPMELSKLLIDGEGLTVYGSFNISNYQEDTAIAEAVINNLNSNLLAGGFDIKQSKYVGFMLCASKNVWNKIPASSVNYANSMIADACGNPVGIFKGVYEIDTSEDCVKVFSMFSGLGLPGARVEQLSKETKAQMNVVKDKDVQRNLSLNIDLGKDQVVSDAQKVKEKIAQKGSTFGKFLNQNVVDRRNKG